MDVRKLGLDSARGVVLFAMALPATVTAMIALAPAFRAAEPAGTGGNTWAAMIPSIAVLWVGFVGLSPTSAVNSPRIVQKLLLVTLGGLVLLSPLEGVDGDISLRDDIFLSLLKGVQDEISVVRLALGFQLIVALLYWIHLSYPEERLWLVSAVGLGLGCGVATLLAVDPSGVIAPMWNGGDLATWTTVGTAVVVLAGVGLGAGEIRAGQSWYDVPMAAFGALAVAGLIGVFTTILGDVDVVRGAAKAGDLYPPFVLCGALVLVAMVALGQTEGRRSVGGGLLAVVLGSVVTYGLLLWDRTPGHAVRQACGYSGVPARAHPFRCPDPGVDAEPAQAVPGWSWAVYAAVAVVVAVVVIRFAESWAVPVLGLATAGVMAYDMFAQPEDSVPLLRAVAVALLLALVSTLHPDVSWASVGLAVASGTYLWHAWTKGVIPDGEDPASSPLRWAWIGAAALGAVLALPSR